MRAVFADTGFWIALLYPSDRWHSQTVAIYQEVQYKQQKVITSEMVLIELLNFFARFDSRLRQKIGKVVQQMRIHPNVKIIHDKHFKQAGFVTLLGDSM